MGLENLKTAFDNIGKNKTVNPKSGVHSPVSDLSQDVSSFKNIPFTEIDSEFANIFGNTEKINLFDRNETDDIYRENLK